MRVMVRNFDKKIVVKSSAFEQRLCNLARGSSLGFDFDDRGLSKSHDRYINIAVQIFVSPTSSFCLTCR